jgi:thiol:disulfide interchange protein
MKCITYLAAFALSTIPVVSSASAKELSGWTENLDQALATAKKEGKSVLVEFTGSDWCPPCMMMRKQVFSKKEFVQAASKKFILVEIDFPQADPDLKKKHEPLAEKYKIEGFPTVLLLNPNGKEFNRFYASQYPKTEDFLKHLTEALEKKDLD